MDQELFITAMVSKRMWSKAKASGFWDELKQNEDIEKDNKGPSWAKLRLQGSLEVTLGAICEPHFQQLLKLEFRAFGMRRLQDFADKVRKHASTDQGHSSQAHALQAVLVLIILWPFIPRPALCSLPPVSAPSLRIPGAGLPGWRRGCEVREGHPRREAGGGWVEVDAHGRGAGQRGEGRVGQGVQEIHGP
eukprot:3787059-Alexandrium_andersonii.AAC.1